MNSDTLFGIVIMVICAMFFVMGGQLRGMQGQAGPGLFPRLVSVVTGIFALLLTIDSVRRSVSGKTGDEEKKPAEDLGQFYRTIVLVALYLVSWNYVHFIICTEIFLLAMCWQLKLSRKFAIIYSTIFSVGIYYIFANIFRILL